MPHQKATDDGKTPLYIATQHQDKNECRFLPHGCLSLQVVVEMLEAGCDTSSAHAAMCPEMRTVFVEHLGAQQRKMLAMASGLHRRLGAE